MTISIQELNLDKDEKEEVRKFSQYIFKPLGITEGKKTSKLAEHVVTLATLDTLNPDAAEKAGELAASELKEYINIDGFDNFIKELVTEMRSNGIGISEKIKESDHVQKIAKNNDLYDMKVDGAMLVKPTDEEAAIKFTRLHTLQKK